MPGGLDHRDSAGLREAEAFLSWRAHTGSHALLHLKEKQRLQETGHLLAGLRGAPGEVRVCLWLCGTETVMAVALGVLIRHETSWRLPCSHQDLALLSSLEAPGLQHARRMHQQGENTVPSISRQVAAFQSFSDLTAAC